MTHREIVKAVAEETNVPQATVNEVLNSFYKTLFDRLLFGVEVKIRGFANFLIKKSPAMIRKNPRTGESVRVPKRYRIQVVLTRQFTEKLKEKKVY